MEETTTASHHVPFTDTIEPNCYQSTSISAPASDSPSATAPISDSSSHDELTPSTYPILTASQTSTCSSSLRFPKPEGSNLLAHWVTSSSTNTADTMHSSAVLDETSSLADSAYELISSTDGESQDGRATDSLADSIAGSFIYPRPDDVHSLNGNEPEYDNESDDYVDDEEQDGDGPSSRRFPHARRDTQTRNTPVQSQLYNIAHGGVALGSVDSDARRSSQADSIRYAEQSLCNPSTQSVSSLGYDSSNSDISGGYSTLSHSIEFEEHDNAKVHNGIVAVKHTIRDFSEAESAIIAANMGMTLGAPKRLAATVCQTMSHNCLSTREPLRVLYVGSDAAYNDIMYKISSALLASAPPSGSAQGSAERRHSSTPGIYNIMPISSFGSAKVPEIDEIQLMGVSEYYIKVERCVKAEETASALGSIGGTYSIELDSGASHVSNPSPGRPTVTPAWTLPQVAVFFVSGNDDLQTETTRNVTWEIMSRHAVPSIFISNTQSFTRSPSAGRWQSSIDQASVHLSLESRDPSKKGSPERLPIDLGSFLNIDARQMNRNIAYLTGLQDTHKKSASKLRNEASTNIAGLVFAMALVAVGRNPSPQYANAANSYVTLLKTRYRAIIVTALISMLVLAAPQLAIYSLGPVLSTYMPSQASAGITGTGFNTLQGDSTTITPTPYSHRNPSTQASVSPSICSIPTIAPTVTISFVTTKTVEVLVPEPTTATSAAFGGFLTEKAHNQKATQPVADMKLKSTGCSIQVHSSHEILVKVSAHTKTKWLAKGAIDIDVWQGQKKLKSKLSTTDEGIIIEIDRNDAFGVMNVSIVTTIRPKINETFAVDFGKATMAQLLEVSLNQWQNSIRQAANTGLGVASQAKDAIIGYTHDHPTVLPASAYTVLKNASSLVGNAASGIQGARDSMVTSYKRIRDIESILPQLALEKTQNFVRDLKALSRRERLKNEASLGIVRAQVKSKLLWLRLRGKTDEHKRYASQASSFISLFESEIRAPMPDESKKRAATWYSW
ncbi:hypothetical protein F503_07960 [Ophiostoma piceae UAMH 11346]|uniref:Uncharacterized protein n=1 Tax=Ophiostoma piceae (strain UAMH 11346) TaxID=1262450 RepID=S3C1A4_OPHP1|nr:hypothetical protein F503_07960 [Ophiostoma piceae UAMH 11346]